MCRVLYNAMDILFNCVNSDPKMIMNIERVNSKNKFTCKTDFKIVNLFLIQSI